MINEGVATSCECVAAPLQHFGPQRHSKICCFKGPSISEHEAGIERSFAYLASPDVFTEVAHIQCTAHSVPLISVTDCIAEGQCDDSKPMSRRQCPLFLVHVG